MDDDVPLQLRAYSAQHVLTYSISRNRNTAFEDAVLYEYGIEISLYDLKGKFLYSEAARCISPDFNKVYAIACILAKNKVYPVHLLEVLDDLLQCDTLPHPENNFTPLKCA